MADSDDEYDRKRRDKFQGERAESYRTSDRRKDEDQWSSRARVRPDYRDRYLPQYQSDMTSTKRLRHEMDDRRMRYMDSGYGGYGSWGGSEQAPPSDMETQPPIMTFKAFLQAQDDNITDEEAIAKYAEYKLEFRRQQLNEFFVAHKEEEWFKLKYHPEESQKRKEEHLNSLRKRANVFAELLDAGKIDQIKVESDYSDAVVKLLDSVVIRLEGGTDLDLTILDKPQKGDSSENPDGTKDGEPSKVKSSKKDEERKRDHSDKEDGEEPRKKAKLDPEEAATEEGEGKKKKKRKKETEEGGGTGAEKEEDTEKSKEAIDTTEMDAEEQKEKMRDDGPPGVDPESESEKEDVEMISVTRAVSKSPQKQDDLPDSSTECIKPGRTDPELQEVEEGETQEKTEASDNEASEKDTSDEVVPLTPRPLHMTSSIYLRTISPRITKSEIESICKKYPGYLRIALAEPQPEQHWFRRGWVTFRRDMNVKDICWNLNNIRVRDCELSAIVNRDLSKRVRTVSPLSSLKQVVLHDIKLCAKLIQDLDARANLWNNPTKPPQESFGLVSGNPVLKGITDFLVDEASAEEEELLGEGTVAEENKERAVLGLRVLDRLLLYLRIVHSVDFYNQSHYPNEDEMPNRCGIMHVRTSAPHSEQVSPAEVSEYMEGFRTKLTSLLAAPTLVEDADMGALGAKSQDSEVEKFILANTQELAKDKWLCPLSGKKFKGPEFVRKHIFNKYSSELEEVKKEVDYFNNYLRDPKRPQLAEHPGSRPGGKKDPFTDSPGYSQPFYSGYRGRGGYSHYGNLGYGGRGIRGFPRGGRGMDYRPVITYRDLDAPCEPEEII